MDGAFAAAGFMDVFGAMRQTAESIVKQVVTFGAEVGACGGVMVMAVNGNHLGYN